MKTSWQLLVAMLVLQSAASASVGAAPNGRPWNFLVLLADDLGAAELGCYGNTQHQTPRLDQLAQQGMRFQTAYVTPLCSPTRVMVMTGRYGFRTGWNNLIDRPGSPTAIDRNYDLAKAERTFGQLLKQHGYATALAGKWQLTGAPPTLVHDCGFDEYRIWAFAHNLPEGVKHSGRWEQREGGRTARFWHPCVMENGASLPTTADDYGPDLYSDFLVDFMRRNQDRPFFAYYPMALTHGPHEAPPDPAVPGARLSRGYASNVAYMDHIVGKMVDAVDELGLAENTLILFLGDNGSPGRGKGFLTEQGVRVPFLVRCPGFVPAGMISDELVSGTDIFPTLMELAGVIVPEDVVLDGVSLVNTLQDPSAPHREWVFSSLRGQRLLRDKRWLLEGDGRFYDCGAARDGVSKYRDMTDSADPEVIAARVRFDEILEGLPAPQEEFAEPGNRNGRRRRQRRQREILRVPDAPAVESR